MHADFEAPQTQNLHADRHPQGVLSMHFQSLMLAAWQLLLELPIRHHEGIANLRSGLEVIAYPYLLFPVSS